MKLLTLPDKIHEAKRNFNKGEVKSKNISESIRYLPLTIPQNREEIVFRKNGKTIDKIIEYDFATNAKIKTTYYDYFNNNKIRSVDEFDIETGRILRTTNYILYKSVDEYHVNTGKKIRTINYNFRDDKKISSIHEYDSEYEKTSKIYIYRKDGCSVSILKELNPITGKVIKWTSYRENNQKINSVSEYEPSYGKPLKTTYFYDDGVTVKDVHKYNNNNISKQKYSKVDYSSVKELDNHTREKMAKLIDNLFKKNTVKFECI